MNLIDVLNTLDKYNKHQFDIAVDEQIEYMSSLGKPKDDIDRSYKQYLCQNYFSPWWVRFIWFSISVFGIPLMLCALFCKRKICYITKIETIAENKGMDEIIPTELSLKYDIHHKEWDSGYSLAQADIHYIMSKLIGIYQPYFVLKAIMQIAAYSARITKYHPDRIITHAEFSFCSSLLTDYCHFRGVKLINVQHGEKLLYIRDSFFHFDECYVWDLYYVNLFIKLNAEPPTQFHVAVPPSLRIDTAVHLNKHLYADYKYYLAADSEEEIKSIVESMSFAKKNGKTVKYRIHPRYTDLTILKKYVSKEDIELPKEVSIIDSISNMEYAVGSYTTVLLQAYLSGKKVLLDDVTFHDRFLQLKDYGYILAKDDIEKLSQNMNK